ncbi:MAG: hypothetical protein ACK6DY_01085, partial [Acidobacteriota bacterium]
MRTALLYAITLSLNAADWPQLRGPDGAGLCPGCPPRPPHVSPTQNVRWETSRAPGPGAPPRGGGRR